MRKLIILAMALLCLSCGREEVQLDIEYILWNSSEWDLEISGSGVHDCLIPPGGIESFSVKCQGEEYKGLCAFDSIYENGFTLIVGGETRVDITQTGWYPMMTKLENTRVIRTGPYSYTVSYDMGSTVSYMIDEM